MCSQRRYFGEMTSRRALRCERLSESVNGLPKFFGATQNYFSDVNNCLKREAMCFQSQLDRSIFLCTFVKEQVTVNPQKRSAGLILSLSVQMQVLLDFCQIFVSLPIVFYVSYKRVLFEGGSLSKIYCNDLFATLFASYFC